MLLQLGSRLARGVLRLATFPVSRVAINSNAIVAEVYGFFFVQRARTDQLRRLVYIQHSAIVLAMTMNNANLDSKMPSHASVIG